MSKFGILTDYVIPIRYSYIPIQYGDTTRAFFHEYCTNCLHKWTQKESNTSQFIGDFLVITF